jgi:tetratricopeptide (TPR) repeat protein
MSAKTAAKRRSASRRRRREFLRVFLALFFVGIFILGTATTAFIFSNQQVAVPTDTPVAQTSPTGAGLAVDQLEKNGDDYLAKNDLDGALSSYSAAAALDQQNAQLQYKIGNILIQQQKYAEAAPHLERAVELDPSGTPGAQAKSLLDQYKNQLPTGVVGTTVPGAQGNITNTAPLTQTAPLTDTNPVSPTLPSPTK